MAIPKGAKANFETLKRAIRNGDCALMEVTDKKTGETVDALCAVTRHDDGGATFAPLAVMVRENPYERFDPPK